MKRFLLVMLAGGFIFSSLFAACDKEVEYKDIVEHCSDGVDNDDDGFVDCDDQDCFASDPACMQEICDDGLDNDGDGLVDCVDSVDCTGDGSPLTEAELREATDLLSLGCSIYSKPCAKLGQSCFIAEDISIECPNDNGMGQCSEDLICVCVGESTSSDENCADGVDNDGDGLTDCLDVDCENASVCIIGQECVGLNSVCPMGVDAQDDPITCQYEDGESVAGVCSEYDLCVCPYFETTITPEMCDDGIDNDADGEADCDDTDCSDAAECQPGVENCADGVDNDEDGKADCLDEDCAANHNCLTEICDNGVDDDGDGWVDCDDAECVNDANCQTVDPETNCDDGVDNDGDGDTDCDDTDCAGDTACQTATETLCDDGVDNDADGDTDCDDTDCDGAAVCVTAPENCTNDIDDDNDGDTDCDDTDCDGHAACASLGNCDWTQSVGDACSNGDGICVNEDKDGDGNLDCDPV